MKEGTENLRIEKIEGQTYEELMKSARDRNIGTTRDFGNTDLSKNTFGSKLYLFGTYFGKGRHEVHEKEKELEWKEEEIEKARTARLESKASKSRAASKFIK